MTTETLEPRHAHGLDFDVRVHIGDDSPDLSWLGEFTDLTADDHGCGHRHVRNSRGQANTFGYFCPSFGCDSRGWREIAADNGWTKEQMFEAASRDMDTAREWVECWVEVQVAGLDDAFATLGGIDANDSTYIERDIVPELVEEAFFEYEASVYRRLMGGRGYDQARS